MGISGLERTRVEDFPLPMWFSVLWLKHEALPFGTSVLLNVWRSFHAWGPPRPANQRDRNSQLSCPLS